MNDTDRKVWLITGSGSGLGRHLAETVLAKGDLLIATARNPARLADLARFRLWRSGHAVRARRDGSGRRAQGGSACAGACSAGSTCW